MNDIIKKIVEIDAEELEKILLTKIANGRLGDYIKKAFDDFYSDNYSFGRKIENALKDYIGSVIEDYMKLTDDRVQPIVKKYIDENLEAMVKDALILKIKNQIHFTA